MAAASYIADLATRIVTLCDSNTGWSELSGHTSGAADATETDYYLQGSACVSQATGQATGTNAGMEYDSGANITWTTGYCFFVWQIFLAPNAIDTWDNGGMRIGVGSTSGNMNYWKAMGNDFGKYPYGGWQNTAIDPTYTPDYTDGTPTAGNYRLIGSWPNIVSAVTKGNPHGVDAIRYGRGQMTITDGDLANGYGTFVGLSTYNDNSSNRFGLFQKEGTGYLWKGLLSFGSSTTACDFRDSNVSITVENTPRTYSSFNKIEIRNASSRVDFNSVSIQALLSTQLSRGELEVIDNADVNFDSCTFIDLNTFTFLSNSSITGSSFIRTGQITQNSALIDGCLIQRNTASSAILSNNPANIQNCRFISDGSNHAIEITTPGTYTFSGNLYTGYAATNGSTGNEAVYNNSGGSVTLNIAGGGATPSIRNGTGASTTVNNNKSVTLTGLVTNTEVRVYTNNAGENDAVVDGVENSGTSFTFSGSAGQVVNIMINHVSYLPADIWQFTIPNNDTSIPVKQIIDRQYFNP